MERPVRRPLLDTALHSFLKPSPFSRVLPTRYTGWVEGARGGGGDHDGSDLSVFGSNVVEIVTPELSHNHSVEAQSVDN
jgi:hypothetical protein